MKMVEKSLSYFHEKLPLFVFLGTFIPSIAFICFLSSYGLSSILITIAILFISTYAFFTKLSKNKTMLCLAQKSVPEEIHKLESDDDDYDDDDDGNDDDDEYEEDGLIEIALMSEEVEEMRKKQSLESLKVYKNGEEEIDDFVNMGEENLIEIDILIGSIKRSKPN